MTVPGKRKRPSIVCTSSSTSIWQSTKSTREQDKNTRHDTHHPVPVLSRIQILTRTALLLVWRKTPTLYKRRPNPTLTPFVPSRLRRPGLPRRLTCSLDLNLENRLWRQTRTSGRWTKWRPALLGTLSVFPLFIREMSNRILTTLDATGCALP